MGMRRRGYTIVEVVIVLMILGIALAVAAPRFARSMATSSNTPDHVIASARHTAVERAQTLSLVIARDGRWRLSESGGSDRDLANGATSPSPATVRLNVSPAGVCIPEADGQNAVTVDPVTCAIHFTSVQSR